MAEGGEQVSGRRKDLIKNCSPCSDKGTEKTATKYCFKCETFFCQECTVLHNALFSNHRSTEIESANIGTPATLYTEPCQIHSKALTLYCKDDDSIVCEECFNREHVSCKEVVYLPSSAKEVIKHINVSAIKSKLRRTIEQFESIKINQQATVTRLEANRETCLKKIDDLHTELEDLLEKIVQSSKDQVEHHFELFSADLQRHRQEVEKCLADLESSEKYLERYHVNEFPLFVQLKKCQTQLKTSNEVSTNALDNLKVKGFSVELDARVQSLLSEIKSLVTVLNQVPVQVKNKYQLDITDNADKNTCTIGGCCELPDGSILLADFSNKMLKCVDQHSLKVKEQCPMQDSPRDVCIINDSEVAVTQQNMALVIVSVKPSLTSTRTIIMNHFCAFVTYCQGELFITDFSETLYIYNTEGSLLRKVSTDPSGQDIFNKTRQILINVAANKVYIADLDKGLIILDREEKVQDKLVIDTIRGARGLCLDGMGGFFVCGNKSHNVVHVGADGQVLTEMLNKSDGLVHPLSMLYNRLQKKLIVTQFNSNQIHVCELE